MELIDKEKVIAEIEKLYKEDYKFLPSDIAESVVDFKDDLLMILDRLSIVKEVDLEKEFDKCCENYIFDEECEVYTAKHFFELGFKAREKR